MANGDLNGTIVAAPPSPFPKRPKSTLKINPALVVDSVTRRAEDIENDRDRSQWMDARLQRYAKYRGWLEEKTFPWAGCSNVHIPVLQIAELRANAGLHNVIMTLRPLMHAKGDNAPLQKEQTERITDLVDYQLIVEPGPELAERRLGDFVSSFLQDGNAVAYTPWVRDEGIETQVTFRPKIPVEIAPADYIEAVIKGAPQPDGSRAGGLFPTTLTIELDEKLDYVFHVTYTDQRQRERVAMIEVYRDEDDALVLVVTRPVTRYDGPVMLPLGVSSLLVPTRCTNLQPPSAYNPEGAPYVFLRWRYRIDEIRRLMQSGKFNYLDRAGFDKIVAQAKGQAGINVQKVNDGLEEQKDQLEGRDHREPDGRYDEDVGHLSVEFLIGFDRWDVDGDGLSEDVIWQIARDADVLCEGRLLTELWPSARPYRPLAEAIAIPVPGRWYGISLLELGEALYDLIKGTFDQSYDSWTFANIPSGFFAASSKMNQDIIRWAPGQLYPVPGNPRETMYFPTLPQRDQTAALGIINLAFQFFERVMAMGALQAGQVPTGQASALRTFGTTFAILQQGDVRADQLLLRLFGGLRQVARNYHRMNRHLLPEGKEIRILGWDGPDGDGYRTIQSIMEIDADADFEFRPDFLLNNPAVLNQALTSVLGITATPLAFQLGVVNAELFYRTLKDFIRSLRLDPKLYTKPPNRTGLPGLFVEEAIDMILSGQSVQGVPMEGAEAHLKALIEFRASKEYKMLTPEQVGLLQAWSEQVAEQVFQERIVMAAQAFQNMMQAGPGRPELGAVNTTVKEPDLGGGAPAPGATPTGAGAINA